MNNKELALKVAKKYDIDNDFSERVLEWFLDEITDALINKETVRLKNFVIFEPKIIPTRLARNPKTDQVETMPPTLTIKTRFSKTVRDAVKNAVQEDECV